MLNWIMKLKNQVSKSVKIVLRSPKSPFSSGIDLAFGKYLFVTNTVSSGVLMIAGDLCQQETEYRQNKLPKRYDFGRLSRMFLVGLCLGPVNHYFYLWLANTMPARNISTVTKKILLDQGVISPVSIVIFFFGLAALERKPVEEWNKELKNNFVEVYTMGFFVWLPALVINFYYLPARYQVFYINSVTTLYNVFLSYIKHRDMVEAYAIFINSDSGWFNSNYFQLTVKSHCEGIPNSFRVS